MTKKIITFIAITLSALLPLHGFALVMPGAVAGTSITQLQGGSADGISAQSYIVLDANSGQVLAQRNSDQPRVPASLTKLVTALVVLDTNPNLKKTVAMLKADEVGGARIATKTGVRYTVDGLFNAALVASANNAAHALARSTGLTMEEFTSRMNQKAADLGAVGTHFYEPTGMDPANVTTAQDFAKIAEAAFANTYIKGIAAKATYTLRATNNSRYVHLLKNTNKLLGDDRLTLVGGKTGYLDESLYNFAARLKDQIGNELIVVLLGSQNQTAQFADTRQLASLGTLAMAFTSFQPTVLGTHTPVSLIFKP